MAKAKMAGTAKLLVPARIVLVSPPAGVAFAIQRGKRELAPVYVSTGADLPLDFGIRVERASGGKLRFTGEFVQGPAGGKFVYVNSGTPELRAKPWGLHEFMAKDLDGDLNRVFYDFGDSERDNDA